MLLEYLSKSAILKPYISEYNILNIDQGICYQAFPQKGTSIAIHIGVKKIREANRLTIIPEDSLHVSVEILGKYLKPVEIIYEGPVKEIAINFTPVGVNAFFNQDFSELAPSHFQALDGFIGKPLANSLFEQYASDDMVGTLDKLFLKKLKTNEALVKIAEAIDMLQKSDANYSVSDLALHVDLNEKTFTRWFKKYAGCTPIQLKRVIRFRKSISIKELNESSQNLTHLALESLFYDSSHFGREYRLLTGGSPSDFFKSTSFQKGDKYPFRFF